MDEIIYIRLAPTDINYFNRIMEGYEYMGVVTTINRCKGIVAVRVTPDTASDVKVILSNLPIHVEYI